MSQVIIAGDTSGTITLQAPAVSGSSVLTLPATTATLATLTTPSFGTTIGVGGATASASGAGISFPATQSASSDANTLDDYEEGTWTPAVTFGGGSTGITYGSRTGKYTKIGNMVYAGFFLGLTSKGSSTGSAVITGLPITSSVAQESRMSTCASYYSNFNTAFGILLLMEASNTVSNLRYMSAGTVTDMNDTHFQNGSSIYGVFIYQSA
jgi:hypothetical protein